MSTRSNRGPKPSEGPLAADAGAAASSHHNPPAKTPATPSKRAAEDSGTSATPGGSPLKKAKVASPPAPIVLKRIAVETTSNVGPPSMVNLESAFHLSAKPRLHGLDTLQPASTCLVNLAVANPSSLRVKNGFISHADDPGVSRIFLIGMITNSSLTEGAKARSVSVAFSDRTFERAMAVAGAVLGKTRLVLPTYNNGISISTFKKTASSPASSSTPASPSKNKLAPSKGMVWGRPVKAWDETIVPYDGRKPFDLLKYRQLPLINGEVDESTAVLAMFTLSSWVNANEETVLSFNIQDVILLRDADDTDGVPQATSKALWMEDEAEAEEPSGVVL
ncbi:hypothetical protein FPV67DRAFT_1699290 [Lyophyllum atratum]|nr:hypothetical protein FPV67DRAFT_1699290 [Lyophyllum atratum]